MQVLEHWAPLDTSEVTSHLSKLFSVPESDLKRNVGNDLKFLREEGEIIPLYFDKLGKLISLDIEPENENFYRIKWQLKESLTQMISGANLLQQLQGFVHAPEGLQGELKIRQGVGDNPQDFIYLYFELNYELYYLQIPRAPKTPSFMKTQTPYLELHLARSKDREKERIADFKKISKRNPDCASILFTINDPFLSSFEEEAPIRIIFHKEGNFNFYCSENKNPVEGLILPEGKAADLLSYLQFFKNKTQTQHWTDLKREEDYIVGNQEEIQGPFIFRIKETTGFLIQ